MAASLTFRSSPRSRPLRRQPQLHSPLPTRRSRAIEGRRARHDDEHGRRDDDGWRDPLSRRRVAQRRRRLRPQLRGFAAPVEPDHPCALGRRSLRRPGPWPSRPTARVPTSPPTRAWSSSTPRPTPSWRRSPLRPPTAVPNAVVTTPPPPPSPPSNLRATVTGNRVSLAWDASPSGALTGYVLEGGVTPGSVLASLPTGSTAPTFTFDAPTGAFFVRHARGDAPGDAVRRRTRSRSWSTCRRRRRRPRACSASPTARTSPSVGRPRRRVGRRRRSSSMSAAR